MNRVKPYNGIHTIPRSSSPTLYPRKNMVCNTACFDKYVITELLYRFLKLYFIPVFIYTFFKVKSNKREKVMPIEDKTYKSDEVFLVVFPLLN